MSKYCKPLVIIPVVLAALIYLGCTNNACAQNPDTVHIPGDINGDKAVTEQDVTALLQHLAGWDVPVDSTALDVNGDGKISNRDATRLIQYLAGWDVVIH